MFTGLVTLFQNSTWPQLLDYVVLALVARYFPDLTPYVSNLWPAKTVKTPVAPVVTSKVAPTVTLTTADPIVPIAK